MILVTKEPPQPGNVNFSKYESMKQSQHKNGSATEQNNIIFTVYCKGSWDSPGFAYFVTRKVTLYIVEANLCD